MGVREMQDMELQLVLRGGGRHDNQTVACCPECAEANRRAFEHYSPYARQERRNVWAAVWDAAMPWLQVLAVWASMALLIFYGPQVLAKVGLWLSR